MARDHEWNVMNFWFLFIGLFIWEGRNAIPFFVFASLDRFRLKSIMRRVVSSRTASAALSQRNVARGN
jgi:hypothetical protein